MNHHRRHLPINQSPIQTKCPIGARVRVSDHAAAAWGPAIGLEGRVHEHWDGMVGVRLTSNGACYWFTKATDLDVIAMPEPDPEPPADAVKQPTHYRSHPSGVECIEIVAHMGFNLGNVIKYVWRADLKHDDNLIDLRKARQYLDFEIARRQGNALVDVA